MSTDFYSTSPVRWCLFQLGFGGLLCLPASPLMAQGGTQSPYPAMVASRPASPTGDVQTDRARPANSSEQLEHSQTSNEQQKTSARQHVIVVLGAEGSDEYSGVFQAWSAAWQEMAERQEWSFQRISSGVNDSADASIANDDVTAKQSLQSAIRSASVEERLWLVFLGHGTFSRNVAKFNLQGPDVSAEELNAWLKDVESQVVMINCSSASAPFLTELAGPNRIVVTATQSGAEYNFARFGQYMSEAINDASIDLDHDQEISLLEAFLAASSNTQRFYQDEARLATEHALLNDNGDKAGTTGDFYRGLRPIKESSGGEIDGDVASRVIVFRSHERAEFSPELERQRIAIEQDIDDLRAKKSLLDEGDYFNQLEELLLQLADLYLQAEQAASAQS